MAKSPKQKIIKVVGYVPVILCLCLLGWGYYAYVFIYCLKELPALNVADPLRIVLIAIVTTLIFLSIWSYLMVVIVHPGTPTRALLALNGSYASNCLELNPAHLNLSERNTEHPVIEVKQLQSLIYPSQNTTQVDASTNFHMITVKQNGERRFCRKCNFEKPDRSHHCSVCGECILKMDHHCPWVNNCIGFYNQKFFLLFVAYTAMLCIILACSLIPGLFNILGGDILLTADIIQLCLLCFMSGLFGLMLVCFTGFHIYLLLNNRTTIENLERTMYKVDQRDRPTSSKYLNIFNIGSYRNFTEVMGPRFYFWFIPIVTTQGNGILYPLNSYAYNSLSTAE